MSLRSEILEQPETLARLLSRQQGTATQVAKAIRSRDVDGVFLAARGSSDNAGLYAKYLWGAHNRLAVACAAPSLFTLYRRPPAIARMLVVGISQSGQSPDIVSVLEEGRSQGALTLAITNDPASPLARAGDIVFETMTGPELAVAATKTFTAQLLAIAMISAALSQADGGDDPATTLGAVPQLVRSALVLEDEAAETARLWREMSHCVVLGRGYNYASAFEWALKLKELGRVAAEPYSAADLLHGPVAMFSPGFPVLAVVPSGEAFADVLAVLSALIEELGAQVVAISNRSEALGKARSGLRLPDDIPEWLSPVVGIVVAQLFCLHLALAKGLDPERPRGLVKVTRTW